MVVRRVCVRRSGGCSFPCQRRSRLPESFPGHSLCVVLAAVLQAAASSGSRCLEFLLDMLQCQGMFLFRHNVLPGWVKREFVDAVFDVARYGVDFFDFA